MARLAPYDVLAKRDTPSWDAVTRAVVDARLAVEARPLFFDVVQWRTLAALCETVLPQTGEHPHVPLPAYVDRKCLDDRRDGYRGARMPPLREAWTRGLAGLDDDARTRHGVDFAALDANARGTLVGAMQRGELDGAAWGSMPADLFFSDRAAPDIVRAYYAHPSAWSEIGFGGPASPRGYVRLGLGKRDPWEAHD